MSELQFGLFEDFKGCTTLLVWSAGEGLSALEAAFRDLGDGAQQRLALHRAGWATPVQGEEVYLDVANDGSSSVSVDKTKHGVAIHCRCPSSRFLDFADMTAALVAAGSGHQYLEVAFEQPLQIMVSKGEYSRDVPIMVIAESS
jgi:hypothetical protein